MASFMSSLTRRQADRTLLMFGICVFMFKWPPPKLFRSNGFSDECRAGASRKSCFDSVRDLTGTNRSPLLEIARVLARFYQIARLIANANHGIRLAIENFPSLMSSLFPISCAHVVVRL
jgi:hypothetical protein